MRTGKLLFCLLCSLIATNGFSQNVRDLMQSFNEYTAAHPVEKIYLHLDKPYYAAGEYMYFRAYLTDIDLNQNAVESHIIYVELSDERKEIVKRTLLYSDSTEYAGQFLLPDSLPSANYHLRAYTNWMRNAGEDYFYHRDIYIGHPTDKKEIKTKPFDYEVAFFPEGGPLLQGVKNKVAFKALGNDGFGANVVGVLKDETESEILHFHSTHLGMGSFIFIPENGKKYVATVESNGRSKEYPIPSAVNGMGLSIEQTPDSIRLTIRSTESSSTPIRVIAQSRHTICYALTGQCQDKEQIVLIPKDKFPTGITQFTLFKDSQPVSERLIFIDRNDNLRITIIPDKEKYSDRDKVELAITVTDKDGNPVEGSFSLAVTDDKVITPSIRTENIKGSLLLDSDLKGFIEQPGWYFDGEGPERFEALDNLLCTQGWTRYSWELTETNCNAFYSIESEFKITGKVTNLANKPVQEGEVILFSNKNIPGSVKTDTEGRFGFYGFNCPDSTVLVLQCRTKTNKKLFIGFEIDEPTVQASTLFTPLQKNNIINKAENTFTTEVTYTEQAVLHMKYDQNTWKIDLPEIKVTATKKRDVQPIGINSYRYTGKILDKPFSMKHILYTLPRTSTGPVGFNSVGPDEAMSYALWFVDGMEIDYEGWQDMYENMPGFMFESVDIIRPQEAAIYGSRGAHGAYVIKTKLFFDQEIPDASIKIVYPEGYCIRKEFYIPAYEKPEVKQNPTPDLRTTIYWNPAVIVDKEGKGYVSFYAADYVNSYSYILEGIAARQVGYTKSSSPNQK